MPPPTSVPPPSPPLCSSEALRRLVAAHQPGDRREEDSRTRILAELDRLDRPCDRDTGPVHATGSAIVAGPRGTVLHRHRRLGRWMQPGGHIDPGEAPSDTAVRETAEETGIAAVHPPAGPTLLHLDVHPASQGHIHLDFRYLLYGADEDPSPALGESPDVAWYTWEEAARAADLSLAGALVAARRALAAGVLPPGTGGSTRGGPDARGAVRGEERP